MIADGEAALVTDVSDLFGLLELGQAAPAAGVDTRVQAPARDRLAGRERAVLDAMPSRVTVDLGEVVTRAAVPTHDALAALGVLAADGWVLEEAGGWRVVPRA
jgi:predicted Rossmann fold nucleotide-binding protein DprA/Smf involved in DNA uptake